MFELNRKHTDTGIEPGTPIFDLTAPRVRVILYLDGKFDSADSGRSRIRRTDAPFRGLTRDSNPRH